MPPKKKAYKDFGGRQPDQSGTAIPLEAEVVGWASFIPAQAQAFLVSRLAKVYESTKESRTSLLRSKELFGPPIKQHNKKFQSGQEQYITVLRLQVSPMQLLVQHSFCKAKVSVSQHGTLLLSAHYEPTSDLLCMLYVRLMQGIPFEAAAWVTEYCDLGGKRASDKLQKYLHLKEAQDLIPEFNSFSTAEQLQKVTALAAQQAGGWIHQLLEEMMNQDIQQAASQSQQTADSAIEMFQGNVTHGLLEWEDSHQAPQHLNSFLGGLGLQPRQFDSVLEAVAHDKSSVSCRENRECLDELTQVQTTSRIKLSPHDNTSHTVC